MLHATLPESRVRGNLCVCAHRCLTARPILTLTRFD